MSAELKPCPFCGTKAEHHRESSWGYYDYVTVRCCNANCIARASTEKVNVSDTPYDYGRKKVVTAEQANQRAAELWNTRAPSPDLDRLRGENERLRAEGDDLRKKLSDLLRYHNFTPNLEKIN